MTISTVEMARLYTDEHLSLGQIAERANVSKTTVWRQLRRLEIPIRPSPSAKPLSANEAVAAYGENGRSITKAAKKLGVSYRDVRRALIRSGTYKPGRIGGLAHLESHHRSGNEEFRCTVMSLYNEGLSKSDIARRVETTRETVDYIIYLVTNNHVPEDECHSST